AGQMQEIARVLRLPGDALSVLKQASEKIQDTITKQEDIKAEIAKIEKENKESAKKPEAPKDPGKLQIPGLEQLPNITPAQIKAAEAKTAQEKAAQDAANAE